jgi:hypothetical protein
MSVRGNQRHKDQTAILSLGPCLVSIPDTGLGIGTASFNRSVGMGEYHSPEEAIFIIQKLFEVWSGTRFEDWS